MLSITYDYSNNWDYFLFVLLSSLQDLSAVHKITQGKPKEGLWKGVEFFLAQVGTVAVWENHGSFKALLSSIELQLGFFLSQGPNLSFCRTAYRFFFLRDSKNKTNKQRKKQNLLLGTEQLLFSSRHPHQGAHNCHFRADLSPLDSAGPCTCVHILLQRHTHTHVMNTSKINFVKNKTKQNKAPNFSVGVTVTLGCLFDCIEACLADWLVK